MQELEKLRADELSGMLIEIAKLNGVLPIVAVSSMAELQRIPTALRFSFAPVQTYELEAGMPDWGWVLSCPTLGYKSYWANVEDDAYKTRYLRFLSRHCGLKLETLPGGYDVDHLYNRERARQYGLRCIRTFPVSRQVNRSHGAGYEKAKTNSERSRQVSGIRKLDEIGFMKLMGLPTPKRGKPLSPEQRAHLARTASQIGLSVEDIERSVAQMMDVAYSGWAD